MKLRYERQLWALHTQVAGLDEVGRGTWAGPVVAACVILPHNLKAMPEVDDSKKLSPIQREKAFEEILKTAKAWSVAQIEAPEIDKINILKATHKAMLKALSDLNATPDHLLIDGPITLDTPLPQTPIIKGDTLSLTIASASIIAKVTRDRLMIDLAKIYPEYGFENHKGYGTSEHHKALKKWGPCPLHRMSFKPLINLLKED